MRRIFAGDGGWRRESPASCMVAVFKIDVPRVATGSPPLTRSTLCHSISACGFDLRGATKVPIKTAARRLERAIDDSCRVEAVKGSPATSDLVLRLLRAPKAIDAGSAKSLTSLSTPARIRCFELLASGPLDWLVAGKDAVVAPAPEHTGGRRP